MTAEEFENGAELRAEWEMETRMTNSTLTFDEWLVEQAKLVALRHVTEEEVEWIRPFVNFTLITNYANKLGKKAYVARNTTLNGVGEIHNNDTFIGFIGHDGEKFVMAFETEGNGVVVPMVQFKQQKSSGALDVDLGGGKRKRYCGNWQEARNFAQTVNATGIYHAKSNGAWVYYMTEVK